jgi:hypothetical protein
MSCSTDMNLKTYFSCVFDRISSGIKYYYDTIIGSFSKVIKDPAGATVNQWLIVGFFVFLAFLLIRSDMKDRK